MDNNTKKKRAEKAKAEEAALNRILCWVTGGAVLEFLLLLLSRWWTYYTVDQIDFRVALGTAVKILAVAALACAAGGAYWWNNARRSGKGTNLPGTLCLFMAGVSLSCFAAWFVSGTGLQLMSYAVPAVVVLALIYYLYQHEFFLIACQATLALLGIWFCSRTGGGSYQILGYVYVVGAAVLVLASAWLCRKAQEEQGKVELGGRTWNLFSKDANYGVLYAGAVAALVTLILAAIGISQMILYGVAVAWLLIMAVYYTVKLM
ncbi:MAG: hypothetical protein HFF06_06055 [Oscillospiraceae bacterium]|jgi:hypothetical protein|nr:hypothetical protein [Oscillospiraceae bacterium]